MPSSLNWIICNFWFKVRHATLCFTWARRGHCRLIKWPKFYTVVSQEIEGDKGEKQGSGQSVEHSEHTPIYLLSLPSYMRVVHGAPTQWQWQHQRSLITDHHEKYNNSKGVWNMVWITKMQCGDEQRKCCWENGARPKTCSTQGCQKSSICLKKKKKGTSAKCSKTRYANINAKPKHIFLLCSFSILCLMLLQG